MLAVPGTVAVGAAVGTEAGAVEVAAGTEAAEVLAADIGPVAELGTAAGEGRVQLGCCIFAFDINWTAIDDTYFVAVEQMLGELHRARRTLQCVISVTELVSST